MNSFDIIETVTNSTPVNVSLEEYLIIVRGPKFLPLKILLPITFTYGILFISGLFGNLAVCIVIAYNKSMHNATNYYLFSLAMSDLVLLLLGKSISLFLVLIMGYKKSKSRSLYSNDNISLLFSLEIRVEPFLSHIFFKLDMLINVNWFQYTHEVSI